MLITTRVNEQLQLLNRFSERGVTSEHPAGDLFTGVDLGTSSIILVVLDKEATPVAAAQRDCEAIRDGVVVDYRACAELVREIKGEIEQSLGRELIYSACAVPPATEANNARVCRYICQDAGFEVSGVFDEPSAAAWFLGLDEGIVVDIGGGTTGLSVIRGGEVLEVWDEATGGSHISLVLMGAYGVTFREAEEMKRDPASAERVMAAVRPVISKMAWIVEKHVKQLSGSAIHLVGGTPMLKGFPEMFGEDLEGFEVVSYPFSQFITPAGIAVGCLRERSRTILS